MQRCVSRAFVSYLVTSSTRPPFFRSTCRGQVVPAPFKCNFLADMQIQHLEIHDLYQHWAEKYDEPNNPLVIAEEKVFKQIEIDLRGKKILDVGCGTGRHAIRMAEAGAEVTGIDFSSNMLEVAKRKSAGLNIKFVKADLKSIPVDELFDIVVCSLVLNHVENLQLAMKEISRHIKKGGMALISDMRSDNWSTARKKIQILPNITTYGFKHSQLDYRAAFGEAGLKSNRRRKIFLQDFPASGFGRRLLLKFFAAGYIYELTKL